jgi:hypothetical protein
VRELQRPSHRKFLAKLLFVFLLAWEPLTSAQQITGRFYPEKQQYLVGEPIIVVFEIVNKSPRAIEIPESSCPSGNQFEVDNAPPSQKIELYGCGRKPIALDCLVGSREIPAGGRFRKRVLLVGEFELHSPGKYHVRTMFEQTVHGTENNELAGDIKIASEFDVRLRAPNRGELEAAYEPFLHDLRGRDIMAKSFAASAINQNPPLFAEAALLTLSKDPEVSAESIEGLMRLATPAARVRLLEMASTRSSDNDGQTAIQALGEIGNPQDCQAMLAIAAVKKNYTQAEAYIMAGRICKENAIPVLNGLVGRNDSQLLLGIAGGLANTSSRLAVSPLIALLLSTDRNARQAAADGLETLTRRTSYHGIGDEDSAKQSYSEWSDWWSVNSTTAPIFSSDQCSATRPLP